jgi:hypothetical protein
MGQFAAIVLICMKSVAPENCSEETAADVLSMSAQSELTCTTGWQDIIARSPLAAGVGTESYVKTLCRRTGADGNQADPPPPAARRR